MFSEPDDSPVYYHPGSPHAIADRAGVLSLKDREAHDILLSSFMVVRKNCDDTCSQKILEGLSDEKQLEYRENSKIGQSTLKTIKDDLSTGLDSCIRRCFDQRLTQHYGKDILDYVHQTAYEYQQGDFHYFNIHSVDQKNNVRSLANYKDLNQRLLQSLNDTKNLPNKP